MSHPVGAECISPVTTSPSSGEWLVAEVIAKGHRVYSLKSAQQTFNAVTATSFLFVPEIHDRVLVFKQHDDAYISQILARSSVEPLALRVPVLNVEATTLQCDIGLLSLAGDTLSLQPTHLEAQSATADVQWQQTVFHGEQCHVELDRVSLISRLSDYCIDTLSAKIKNSLQWIETLSQQMLGRCHISVQKHYQLDCESVDIYSQEDVKIDAKQIHLG